MKSPSLTHVLLVDDDDPFADMLQRALQALGFAVTRARNGQEAVQCYDRQPVSLVLTDLIMPDMEGIELIQTLRRRNPAVRIIAMSGGGRNQPEAYLAIARRLGAVNTLTKPFPLAELHRVLKEALADASQDGNAGDCQPARTSGAE
jgi:CheY-like chemotaxis protein